MAIARIAVFPGGTKEQYDYLGTLMGEGVANQPERRMLAAGPTTEGWRIIQAWGLEGRASTGLSRMCLAQPCSKPVNAAIPSRPRSRILS